MSIVLAIGSYMLFYLHGSMFNRVCGDQSTRAVMDACVTGARHGWWADWHNQRAFAVLWVAVVALALSLGWDNYRTTDALTKAVGEALLTVVGILDGLTFGLSVERIEILLGLFVVLSVTSFFVRLNAFRHTLKAAAHETLVARFDEIYTALGKLDADSTKTPEQRAELKGALQDNLNWLIEHGVLPPLAVDERLRVYAGYLGGLLGLLLALVPILQS